MAREFTTVGVVGLGTMGAGIVEVFARNGIDVVAVEVGEAALERGRGLLARSTERAVSRGKLSAEDAQALHERISYAADLVACAGCDLVIEAVPEFLELKKTLLGTLDGIVAPDAVLATNTSSLSVTEIAVATANPRRVVGMHFFNPATVLRLVEVISTVVSDPEVVAAVASLAGRLGKKPVVIGDRAGFIANALLFGYLNHAVAMYESRQVTREDLDAAMRLGCGFPMGPLALLDLIGLDTAYEILETMYAQTRDRLHAPSPVLRQLVTAGMRGRKSGRGFYTYAGPMSSEVVADALTPGAGGPGDAAGADAGRSLERIAVLGSGERSARLVELATAAGYAVTCLPAPGGGEPGGVEADGVGLADADLVIVAAGSELATASDLAAVRDIFAELDWVCRPGAILASDASLPVTELAAATGRPDAVIGLRIAGPAGEVRLAEIVHTVSTAAEVRTAVVGLVERLGLYPVQTPDRAGFVVDALLVPYLNDAIRMHEAGYASVADIDTAMTAGCGLPAGPFAMLDELGLDVALAKQQAIFQEFREPGLAPAPLLQQLVQAGHLGRGSGRGFTTYE